MSENNYRTLVRTHFTLYTFWKCSLSNVTSIIALILNMLAKVDFNVIILKVKFILNLETLAFCTLVIMALLLVL